MTRDELRTRVRVGLEKASRKGALALEETGWMTPEDWDALIDPVVDELTRDDARQPDSQEFEDRLASLTEDDAGYRNERDYHARCGLPALTLEQYKGILRFRERDSQQMTDMGR